MENTEKQLSSGCYPQNPQNPQPSTVSNATVIILRAIECTCIAEETLQITSFPVIVEEI